MSSNLTPLQVCERLIGNVEALSVIVGFQPKAFYPYRHPTRDRDAGDFPSTRIMRALLAHSATYGLGLTADHLIHGATEAEIMAILAARAPRMEAAE